MEINRVDGTTRELNLTMIPQFEAGSHSRDHNGIAACATRSIYDHGDDRSGNNRTNNCEHQVGPSEAERRQEQASANAGSRHDGEAGAGSDDCGANPVSERPATAAG